MFATIIATALVTVLVNLYLDYYQSQETEWAYVLDIITRAEYQPIPNNPYPG